MTARSHPGLRAGVGLSVLAVLGVVLGGLIVRKTAADALILSGRYTAAMALGGSSKAAATRLGVAATIAGRNADARSAARDAIAAAPLTTAALRTLGLVDQARGRPDAAGRWMNFSAALGWRDPATRIWLARTLLIAGRGPDAIVHLDALLRQKVMVDPVSRVLDQLADDDAARAAIITALAGRPPWRDQYFFDVDRLGERDIAGRHALLAGLARVHSPVDRPQSKRWIDRLMVLRRPDLAYVAWHDFAADPGSLSNSGLYDGDFRKVDDDVQFPFEWTVAGGSGTDRDSGDGPGRITVPAAARGTVLLQQTARLASGPHILAMTTDIAMTGPAAPTWTLACPQSDAWVPITPTGTAARDRVLFRFAVPAGCGLATLTLRAGDAGIADGADRWVSNIAVLPDVR